MIRSQTLMIGRLLAAIALALAAAAVALAPILLQNPFASQTAGALGVAHALRTWGFPLTTALAAIVIALVVSSARRTRWWGKALLVLPVAVALAAAWVARQNPFEWWFNGVPRPRFVPILEATFVEPNDLVLSVSIDGDAAAYPVRLVAYHHVVNDRIGGTPAVVTY